MKVFVVGEGRNDLGDLADLPQYRRGNSGYYQPLLRTMLGVDTEFDGRKIVLLGRDQPKSRAKAARKKADVAVALAAAVEADLLVYSADGDHDFEARRRRLTADLEGSDIPWAVAMPKATLEAWIIGDHASLPWCRRRMRWCGQPPSAPADWWEQGHEGGCCAGEGGDERDEGAVAMASFTAYREDGRRRLRSPRRTERSSLGSSCRGGSGVRRTRPCRSPLGSAFVRRAG